VELHRLGLLPKVDVLGWLSIAALQNLVGAGGSKASLTLLAIPFAQPEPVLDLSQTGRCPAFGM
jgi:hypothetical protein